MSTAVQGNVASPIMQEAYQLLGQLSENHIADVVKFIKQLISKDEETEEEYKADLARKQAAFAELMKIREEVAKLNLGPIEKIREEAIAEKYGTI